MGNDDYIGYFVVGMAAYVLGLLSRALVMVILQKYQRRQWENSHYNRRGTDDIEVHAVDPDCDPDATLRGDS